MSTAIGVDIGGTKGAVIAFDTSTWQVRDKRLVAAAPCRHYLAAIRQAIAELTREDPPIAVGIACGGPLDLRTGTVLAPPHLTDWDTIPIVAELSAAANCPAILQNDANAGAMAERYWGAGRAVDDLVFITFGTGFGAGIIANGRLVAGHSGQAGEIGHVRLQPDGPPLYGKAGSIEGLCSGGGIASRFKRDPRELFTAATAREPQAREQLRQLGEDVGRALAILVDLLNPRRIILGGIYARHHQLLHQPLRRGLTTEALPLNCRDVEIVPAELGEAIGDHATMAIVRDHLERNP